MNDCIVCMAKSVLKVLVPGPTIMRIFAFCKNDPNNWMSSARFALG